MRERRELVDDHETILPSVSARDLTTNRDRFGIDDEYALAPGTMRWFTTREAAQVTLHQVTNFDRRPWKP